MLCYLVLIVFLRVYSKPFPEVTIITQSIIYYSNEILFSFCNQFWILSDATKSLIGNFSIVMCRIILNDYEE